MIKWTPFQKFLGRLGRFKWSLHNIVAHPVAEVLWWVGLHRASFWVHDATIPEHDEGEER